MIKLLYTVFFQIWRQELLKNFMAILCGVLFARIIIMNSALIIFYMNFCDVVANLRTLLEVATCRGFLFSNYKAQKNVLAGKRIWQFL